VGVTPLIDLVRPGATRPDAPADVVGRVA
jgi:hypothetical protein